MTSLALHYAAQTLSSQLAQTGSKSITSASNIAIENAVNEKPDALILLEQVSYAREGNQIFQDLSLTLNEQRIALIGRNGSGKSTLSRLICGLAEAESGSIKVAGQGYL